MKDDGFEFVLMSKELCGQPAEKSKSKYVVKARVLLESGEILTGYLDPKTNFLSALRVILIPSRQAGFINGFRGNYGLHDLSWNSY